jgi:hypothetical protein
MNRKKVKHSKYKNTGLIFEFLLRQITADVLDKKKSKALSIVKKRFNENTELGKELGLYNILINEKFKSERKADYFITEVLSRRKKLSNSNLKREKYNVIKEIMKTFSVDKFFTSNVPEYKTYASIYKLFEHTTRLSPEDKTESYFNILEHVTTNKTISSKLPKDEDLRILTYKTLLEKFNAKYTNLNSHQRGLLKAYINNISNNNSLTEFMQKRIPLVRKELKKYSNNVKDRVTKIKLKEAIKSIDKFVMPKSNKVKDINVVQMMRYYELLKELKSGKK